MKYLSFGFLFLILFSCASHRSGKYVQQNGKWIFVASKVGFRSQLAESRVDTSNYDHLDSGEFIWPVPGSKRVSSHFGKRGSGHHDGVDIAAKTGTNIIASNKGVVSFAGRMRGYGKTVIIKHPNGHHTVYAHANKYFVSKGQKVSQGEVIAHVGSTGRSSGPHLHFEIRKNNKVRNPASYLNRLRP